MGIIYDNGTIRKRIISHYRKKELIPFIGAGFSSDFAPQWDEFRKDLFNQTNRFRNFEKLKIREIKENFEALEIYVRSFKNFNTGKAKLFEYIRQKLTFKNIRGHLGNMSIVIDSQKKRLNYHNLLSKKFKNQVIYTTNWDNLIEKTTGKKPICNRFELLKRGYDKNVIKFHGSVHKMDKYGDALMACKTDYWDRISKKTPFDILFQNDYLRNYFLFLGYSITDQNISLLIYQLMRLIKSSSNKPRIYWAVAESSEDKRVRAISEHAGIQPFFLLKSSDQKALKSIKQKLSVKCNKCRLYKLVRIHDKRSLPGSKICIKCDDKKQSDLEYKIKRKLFIDAGILNLLNSLKNN